jgi:hypothetical protein
MPSEALYLCNIQYAGSKVPFNSRPGLGLLPGHIVYNGKRNSFLECFGYQSSAPLPAGLTGLFFDENAALSISPDGWKVMGKGHVIILRAKPGTAGRTQYEVLQYGPEESIPA